MKRYPILRVCWSAVNIILVLSLGAVLYSAAWEFSTRSYLKGFSDAIIPSTDNPVQKVEAILDWMAHGPPRRASADTSALAQRDPEETLNIQQLLDVCGTATNAFVNLAQIGGLHARRLLLLDENRITKHVVAEVLIDGRWVVVDPLYRSVFRLPNGQLLTRSDLQNPAIFKAATQPIPNYPQSYTYEDTVHVRIRRIPVIGADMRGILDYVWPRWEVSINWTLLLERESFAMLVASSFLLFFALAARLFLGWYCSQRLGIPRVRMRDQVIKAGQVLIGNPK